MSVSLLMTLVDRDRRAARTSQALLWARTAVFVAPARADAWRALSGVYRDLGLWAPGRVACAAATHLDPDHGGRAQRSAARSHLQPAKAVRSAGLPELMSARPGGALPAWNAPGTDDVRGGGHAFGESLGTVPESGWADQHRPAVTPHLPGLCKERPATDAGPPAVVTLNMNSLLEALSIWFVRETGQSRESWGIGVGRLTE